MTKKKQIGGDKNNVITASVDIIKSMTELGKSIFTEISSITNIQSDINNGTNSSSPVINSVKGPPHFEIPKLK